MDNKKNKTYFGIILIVNIVLAIACIAVRKPYLDTVDDSRMRDIASGAITGEPDGKLVFILYPLGWIISVAYKMFPQIPWYIGFLIGGIVISLTILLYHSFRLCRSYLSKIVVCISYLFLYFSYFSQLIVYPQFTKTAGALGATALIILITARDETKKERIFNGIVFVIISTICYLYRTKVFMMMLPIAFIIIIEKCINNILCKEYNKIVYKMVLVASCIASLLFVQGINDLQYSSKEHRGYREFNVARSLINDYYKMPDYEANKEFFDSIDIDKTSWQVIRNYSLMLGDNIKTEQLNKIVEFQKKERYKDKIGVLKKSLDNMLITYKNFGTFNLQPIFLLFMSCILFMIPTRKKVSLQIYIGGAIAMGIFGSIYFLYTLRFPERVAVVLWLPLAFIVICSIGELFNEIKASNKIIILTGLIIIFGMDCLKNTVKSDKVYYNKIKNDSENYIYMIDYCRKNPENFYFYYVYSFANATDEFRIEDETELLSWTSLGGWLTRNPLITELYSLYGFSSTDDALLNHDNVYVAITTEQDLSFLNNYVQDRYPNYEWVTQKYLNDNKIVLISLRCKEV